MAANTFDYFKLDNVFSVHTKTSSKQHRNYNKVTINAVAYGELMDNSITYLAISCSNDYIIIKKTKQGGYNPIIRTISYFVENQVRIIGMNFSPSSHWLLCATSESSLYIIPIHSLFNIKNGMKLGKYGPLNPFNNGVRIINKKHTQSIPSLAATIKAQQNNNNSIASEYDITKLSVTNINGMNIAISSCLWWNSYSNDNYAIASTFDSELIFIDIKTNDIQRLKLASPIMKIELFEYNEQLHISNHDKKPIKSIYNNELITAKKDIENDNFYYFLNNSLNNTSLLSSLNSPIDKKEEVSISSSISNTDSNRSSNTENIMINDYKQWKGLLIHTMSGINYIMILEYRQDEIKNDDNDEEKRNFIHTEYPNYFNSPFDDKFKVKSLKRFDKNYSIRIQYIQSLPYFSVYNKVTNMIELYDIYNIRKGKALFTFTSLPNINLHLFLDNFIYAITRNNDQTLIHIIQLKNQKVYNIQQIKMAKMYGISMNIQQNNVFIFTIDEIYNCIYNDSSNIINQLISLNTFNIQTYQSIIYNLPNIKHISYYYKKLATYYIKQSQYKNAFILYSYFFTDQPDIEIIKTLRLTNNVQCLQYAILLLQDVVNDRNDNLSNLSLKEKQDLCDIAIDCYIDNEKKCVQITEQFKQSNEHQTELKTTINNYIKLSFHQSRLHDETNNVKCFHDEFRFFRN